MPNLQRTFLQFDESPGHHSETLFPVPPIESPSATLIEWALGLFCYLRSCPPSNSLGSVRGPKRSWRSDPWAQDKTRIPISSPCSLRLLSWTKLLPSIKAEGCLVLWIHQKSLWIWKLYDAMLSCLRIVSLQLQHW